MPAAVAYAAADAEVLPVEAQITAFAPAGGRFEMAIVMPRSLKEPVGLTPSNLSQTSQPVRAGEGAGRHAAGCRPRRG